MNDKNQIEPKPENDVISIAVMQVTTVFLLTTIIMKVFSLLKVLPSIGAFTAVTYSILASTAHFSLFFGAWLNLFMVLFMICGITIGAMLTVTRNDIMTIQFSCHGPMVIF